MIKSELIALIAEKFNQLPAKEVEAGVNQILEEIVKTLAKNGRVEIRGFGSFCLHHQPSRKIRNPKTQKDYVIPSKYSPYFRAGKELKKRIDQARQRKTPIAT